MIQQEAVFIGANRQVHVGDVHRSKHIVAYGAGSTIALWEVTSKASKGVYSTLKGHTAEVTCVRFIPDSQYLISAAEDSTVKIWRFKNPESLFLEPVETLAFHVESVIAITIYQNLFATSDSSGNIAIWKLTDGKCQQLYNFNSPQGVLPLTLALQDIAKGKFILAVGGSSFHIYVYAFTIHENSVSGTFEEVASLKGHEDWVKALDFKKLADGDYLLASGSQDRYIRLWRIRIDDLIDNSDEDDTKLTLLGNKQYKFNIQETKVAINFEALIMGHDDWISSLRWHETQLKLLASTADTALMIWEPDDISGIWICSTRLGEISSKGASTATGSAGGFWDAIWFTDGDQIEHILTNGKTGSWRQWVLSNGEEWTQTLAVTGANKPCTDVSWSIHGEYLLSTSLDQTTRLYSQWITDYDGQERAEITWQEFARPQIHGYDMICISTLSNTRFISGGDEKILRSFEEPRGVGKVLEKFCRIMPDAGVMPDSASVPVLGLSNKATSSNIEIDNQAKETAETTNISYDILSTLTQPPFEDHLQRHALWPEIEKLYGHGYEIVSVDTSPDKSLIASSCKSNTLQHAVVRIFDSNSWQELKPNLKLHNLTVTRVKFSPDNQYLLTVSRDRQFGVWRRDFTNNTFELVNSTEKAHTRIIWDCSWSPTSLGKYFVTASRDKSIKIWHFDEQTGKVSLTASQRLTSAVTSVDVHKTLVNGKLLICAGLETGSLVVLSFTNEAGLAIVSTLPDGVVPAGRISRVSWSALAGDRLLLAVASHDHSVRVYSTRRELV